MLAVKKKKKKNATTRKIQFRWKTRGFEALIILEKDLCKITMHYKRA